jgi:hypothetical protein
VEFCRFSGPHLAVMVIGGWRLEDLLLLELVLSGELLRACSRTRRKLLLVEFVNASCIKPELHVVQGTTPHREDAFFLGSTSSL